MAAAEINVTGSKIEHGVILIGKTGSGKSTLGNRLLQQKMFQVSDGCESETTVCKRGEQDDNGRKMLVVDTPGFFDTRTPGENQSTLNEATRALVFSLPGPHVFIFVLKWDRLTEEEMNAFDLFKTRFGDSHLIIAFTHTEKIKTKGKSVKDFAESPQIKTLLKTVGDKYVEFSDGPGNEEEISQLHELIDRVSEKLKNYYTNDDLEKMAATLQSRMEKKMRGKGMSEEDASKEVADEIAKWDVRKKFIVNLLGIGASVLLGAGFAGAGGGAAAALGFASKKIVLGSAASGATSATATLAAKQIYPVFQQKMEERKKSGKSCCIS